MKENTLKNIVIINDFEYVNGGAAKVAIDTAELLASDKTENIYFFSAVSNGKKDDTNIKYICTNQAESLRDKNKIRGSINNLYNFKAKKELGKLLNTLDPNNTVIHIHGWSKALSCSIFDIIDRKRFKMVVTFHDYFFMCPNGGVYNFKKNNICQCKPLSWNCVKCNCDSRNYLFKIYRCIRQFIQNKVVKIDKKIKYMISISSFSYNVLKPYLPNNINVRRIENPIDARKENKINNIEQNKYYVYVGRISQEKGINLFCKTASKYNIRSVVVGDGEKIEELKKEYPDIEFAGWKNKNEVLEYMRNARALIFPSLLYEGAPLTIQEALSVGLPCVVSDCCAATDYITNEINGFVFKSNDIDDLGEKINKLNDNNLLNKLSNNAFDLYWKNPFDTYHYKEQIREYYMQILND